MQDPSTPAGEWHTRFQQQAAWTSSLRQFLLSRLELPVESRILEVGCGTGVISSSLQGYTQGAVIGLDFNFHFLNQARLTGSQFHLVCADAFKVPFQNDSFDAVVCHFFLLWLPDPAGALAEMIRAARPGSPVIAFAEPDYGGRIDYPPELENLGRLQAEALRIQGADPNIGRKLSKLFHQAGLAAVETGLLGGQWNGAPSSEQQESEWRTLRQDLAAVVPAEDLDGYQQIDAQAWRAGQRVLFVPTFYAAGRKK